MAELTEDLADKILNQMGDGPALVICLRLILGVGHGSSDREGMLEAVQEAIAAVKRVGAIAGAFEQA